MNCLDCFDFAEEVIGVDGGANNWDGVANVSFSDLKFRGGDLS